MNMKFKKAIIAALATMVCSISGNALISDQDNETKETSEGIDTIDKTEELEEKEESKLEEQSRLVEKAKEEKSKSIKHKINRNALESLTKNKFKVTDKTIEDLNDNFGDSKINVNLFEEDNLDIALGKLVSFSLEEKGKVTGFDVEKNKSVESKMKSLNKYLGDESNKKDKNKEVEILNKLNDIKEEMDKDKVNSVDGFCLSMKTMRDAYSTSIARKTADDMLNKNRKKIEKHMSKLSSSKSATVKLKGGIKAIDAGVIQDIKKSEKSSENSFYTVDIGGNTRISFGTDICKAIKADLGENLGVTKSVIYNSLEQYLDSGEKPNIIYIEGTDIKKVLNSRNEMKKKEKKLLSDFNIHIESYLKSLDIIPDSVYIEWPEITRSKKAQRSKTKSIGLDSTVSILESVGFKVSVLRNSTDIKRSHLYLELIKDDCSPVGTSTSSDIKKFISVKNKKGEKYECKKYKEVKKLINEDNQKLDGVVSLILGDLRRYNHALSVLSSDRGNEKIEAKEKSVKRDIEKRWLSEKFKLLKQNGRNEMLKSALVVSTYLRDYASTDEDINSFKSLYEEINRLSKLQEFSSKKDKDKFDVKRTVKKYNINGTMDINVPIAGDVNMLLSYSNIKGAPFETGKEVTVSIKIPSNDVSKKVLNKILDKIEKIDKKLSEDNTINLNSKIIQNSLNLVKNVIKPALSKVGCNVSTNLLDKIKTKEYINLSFNMRNIEENSNDEDLVALPSSKLIIKDKDHMALKYVKRTDIKESKLDLDPVDCVKVKCSSEKGKSNSFLGDDTLSFITNRYNVFAMGQEDIKGKEHDKSDLWISMRENNKDIFKNMIKNIGKEDSNIRYELQGLYNNLIKKTENEGIKTNCENTYREFLDICDNLEDDNEKQFESAFLLLDDILDMNYKYVFIPQYNNEFC